MITNEFYVFYLSLYFNVYRDARDLCRYVPIYLLHCAHFVIVQTQFSRRLCRKTGFQPVLEITVKDDENPF